MATDAMSEVVNQHKSLVPVRVDLYYQLDAFGASDAMLRVGWVVTSEGIWMPVPSCLQMNAGRPETRARIDTAAAMAHRDSFFGNRRGADSHLFDRMVGHVCKLEQGGRSGANHFHCVFFFDAKGLTVADVNALKYGLGNRWQRATNGMGMMFDCHDKAYRRSIESRGSWVLNLLDSANQAHVGAFVGYIVGYFTKDDGQMVRVMPTLKAQTFTKGR
ncbi:inovirus-type Gp2 protein [Paraburkholderia graminis]|uniref:Inovirus Gp2 family protein n=1 Tax=Paraburkholderia graminis TaxID=60548 RepID=A0ABD5CBB7_9BURK|nr:inovirus-type Gp2 protein [Paraburkholderia graminis]MDR6202502.1 hypothetical protein [Paraburkholderia graminis]